MSRPDPARLERAEDLMADRALFGLGGDQPDELAALLADLGISDSDDLERAAAALDLALEPPALAPLPAALRRRVASAGQAWCAGISGAPGVVATSAAEPARPAASSTPARPARVGARPAWWVAAAAALLALIGWWPRLSGPPAPGLAEQRARLLTGSGALERDWTATELAPGAAGDVVWDQQRQAGFMRFRGLAANDPSQTQYQLWIFDEGQEHPVDGGVFDVTAGGEVIVPIDAKLGVARPTLFAITVEKPGGVVVSDQQRIALVAQV